MKVTTLLDMFLKYYVGNHCLQSCLVALWILYNANI